MSDRYDDKPFLRYVDAWVLNAIGHLDEPTRAYCVAMEPTIRQSLGLTGSWVQMVAQQMKFGPELPDQVRKIWEEGRLRFEQGNGRPADPVQFAMTFVDRNFGRT
ncbi:MULTISPECIES: hypothetical protein [unclassified Sphingopyxis]|uniref:hypothetical protein n=1 Tax=unclassified Sphingopyxis TaxID=2614943 RepID=UPI0007311F19|nr:MULTISPECIES: hypothetical protein [unclassified Sphingopyxis]KTE24513.1 hypothetical protein ATE61_14015 [Sphingopyxis sp. H057]KTE49491.1 hypothetical protein ATE69_20195 [Sphingopyxis sp. H071]KTE52184.1 hypothetical protein ATE64_12320 [Sphingopyxis sp. H073]KTE60483.1 hypothetical protein ATE66_07825 [Sphingopyxis sp. H107]KTE63928.1 hypothetical protein ATE65_14110 [Sphingopyxis sp. H100]